MILRAPLNNSQCAKDNPAVPPRSRCGKKRVTAWSTSEEGRWCSVHRGQQAGGQGRAGEGHTAVQVDLQALQTQYPDSRYKDGVAVSLATVAAAIQAENQ